MHLKTISHLPGTVGPRVPKNSHQNQKDWRLHSNPTRKATKRVRSARLPAPISLHHQVTTIPALFFVGLQKGSLGIPSKVHAVESFVIFHDDNNASLLINLFILHGSIKWNVHGKITPSIYPVQNWNMYSFPCHRCAKVRTSDTTRIFRFLKI